ncbi:hypothetical protein WDU94_010600 [Cyamophila willieti]
MRLTNPRYYEQVNIVCGQLETENFGLCPTDLQALISNTSIIFHVAATVRFDEHIRTAYNINVVGTNTILSLAKQMTHLKSFVHVSTAYSHCDKWSIDETFYSPTLTANELSIITQHATDEQLAILNEHLIGNKPNTYTLTKATAEDLVREAVSELPISVFRPSVVFPTLEEPMPFWMKGFNSVLAVILAIGIGLYRVYLGNADCTVDIVPADRTINAMMKGFNSVLAIGVATATGLYRALLMNLQKAVDLVPSDRTINAMVALAWYQTIPKQKTQSCSVLNFVSADDNSILSGDFLGLIHRDWILAKEANKSTVWKTSYVVTSNPTLYTILFYIFHFVPAIVFSLTERLTNQKPQVMKFYRKIKHFGKLLAFFCLNEWQFENNNLHSMIDAMSIEDRKRFDASLNTFTWKTMFRGSLHRAVSLYMLRERVTKEEYKKKMVYRVLVHNVLTLLVKALSVYFILYFTAQLINKFFVN